MRVAAQQLCPAAKLSPGRAALVLPAARHCPLGPSGPLIATGTTARAAGLGRMQASLKLRSQVPSRTLGSSVRAQAASEASFSAPGEHKSLAPVLYCVAVAACGAFAFGYHLGVVNGPLEAIATELSFAGSSARQGAVVSSLLAGAAVGSLAGSGLADKLGRRGAFLLDCLPLLGGAALCALATSLRVLIAGRLLAGVGIGLCSALVPLYISEVAPTELRGTLGSLNQLSICIGILAALVVNVVIPATSWRSMFLFAGLPAVLLGLGMLMAPESPRWLASTKRDRPAAEAAARRLWGATGAAQLAEPGGGSAAVQPTDQPGLGEVLASKGAIIGCVLFLFQQLSGINAVVYFSSSVFAQAGIQSPVLASAAVGATNVLGTVVAASLMDKLGRKQLLTLSFGGMCVAMLAMAAGLSMASLASASGTIAFAGTLLYVASFALGAGPVPGLLVPEITPARVRGRAVSLAMVVHWVTNFALGQLFLPALNRFGVSAVYIFFAAVCVSTIIFTQANIVETKGRSLEDIEKAMAR